MAIVVGIDPGSDRTGIAVVEDDRPLQFTALNYEKGLNTPAIVRCLVAPLEMLFEGCYADLVVVEGQHYFHSNKAPPRDILKLANIAGAIAGMAATRSTARLAIPTASEWKGSTPKPINQARTYSHFGISYKKGANYSWPAGCSVAATVPGYGQLKRGDWKEVGDALGLARYGVGLLGS